MRRATSFAILALGSTLFARSALADSRVIPADRLEKVRVDGLLKEWPESGAALTQKLKGSPDAKAEGMVGYDDKALYVAFDVRDGDFVPAKDHGTLLLEIPQREGRASYEVEVYPGKPGKSAGTIKINGRKPAGAEVVEHMDEEGFTVEARIPWSAFPAAARVRVGMRAALSYTDAGGGAGVLGTGKRPLMIEAELSLKDNLLDKHELKLAPAREAYGNVWGDGALERVAIYGGYLVVTGAGFKGGKEFYFKDLEMPDASLVTRFELRDMNGDDTDEIILARKTGPDTYREIFEIMSVSSEGVAERAFAHEVAIVTHEGAIENEVKLVGEGKSAVVKISQGKAEGFDPDSFREPPHEGMATALLPWDGIGTRTIKWDGSGYAVSGETKEKPRIAKKKKKGKPARKPGAAPGIETAPPPPRPPSAEELLDKLYALYRKERGKQKSEPRFDFVTDVAGDPDLERVLVHGKEIVVFGRSYRDASSYAFIDVGVAVPEDVLDVTARDLTGDGKAEVIVRGVLHAKAGKELEDEPVHRQALFIYQVSDQGIGRVFAAETGRYMDAGRVLGAVAFTPAAHGFDITLLPGRAAGWTKKTYPFPQDEGPAGGLEPLLLPWTGGKRTYAFTGSTFAPR